MRTIDADDLQNKVQGWYGRTNFSADGILSIVESEIINAPTINSSTWIPVTERLPEKEGEYLVTWKWEDGELHIGTNSWSPKAQNWAAFRTIAEITAWMPLPKPYEGSKEEC